MSVHTKIPVDVTIPQTSLWHRVPMISGLIGVVCLAMWWLSAKQAPDRAAFAYLFAYICVLSIVLGAMAFVILQHLTRAGWSVLVRRVPETMIATMPLFVLLFIPIVMNMGELYPWMHVEHLDPILKAKVPYLNTNFFLIRAAVYLSAWTMMGLWFYRKSVGQDDGQRMADTRKMWTASAPAIIIFGMSVTFASFDWVMSLQPHWYSTIFGVYFFAGCMLAALSMMVVIYLLLQRAGVLKHAITKEHYHDIGKLMFGFTVFWAYCGFSQFMLIWYANIPEEVEFYTHRLDHGWQYMSWAIPVLNFFVPFFFLLSRHMKRKALTLALGSIWVLCVHFLDIFWIILPNYGSHGHAEYPHMHFEWCDISALLGIFGLFMAVFTFILLRRVVAPMGDSRLHESVAFENF